MKSTPALGFLCRVSFLNLNDILIVRFIFYNFYLILDFTVQLVQAHYGSATTLAWREVDVVARHGSLRCQLTELRQRQEPRAHETLMP